ncbi:MAG: hypothetical protein U9R79_02020 [Armatimonadota bacterium]|nr:hypothetical protein [Armatimonadota bacterium]
MAEEQESPQRKAARMKMREARQLFEGRHPERGVEAMREVLELDPEFIEPRRWLARYYLQADEKHRAIAQYEEMLRVEPDNEELWEELREIDPATAQRLERLQHIAPDPFVAQRADADLSDLDDFEDEDEEEEEAVGAPFQASASGGDEILAGDEEEEEYIEAAEGTEPLPWDHEQDAEYRDQLNNIPAFVDVLDGFTLFWQDPLGWSHLVGQCSAPEDARWRELENMLPTAAGSLHVVPPSVLVLYQHTRMPLALPMKNATVVMGEPYRMAFTGQELLFALGLALHGLLNENAEYWWAAEHIIDRDVEDCDIRRMVVEGAADFTVGWDEGLPREEIVRLMRLAHAWEMRAVLSADRAGLLASGDVNCACRTIAAMVSPPGEAGMVSVDEFLSQFKGTPAGELAAIGVKQDPWTDPRYAAYRIQMLQWWATTDEYKDLR